MLSYREISIGIYTMPSRLPNLFINAACASATALSESDTFTMKLSVAPSTVVEPTSLLEIPVLSMESLSPCVVVEVVVPLVVVVVVVVFCALLVPFATVVVVVVVPFLLFAASESSSSSSDVLVL